MRPIPGIGQVRPHELDVGPLEQRGQVVVDSPAR
jgi:hypothetical protein